MSGAYPPILAITAGLRALPPARVTALPERRADMLFSGILIQFQPTPRCRRFRHVVCGRPAGVPPRRARFAAMHATLDRRGSAFPYAKDTLHVADSGAITGRRTGKRAHGLKPENRMHELWPPNPKELDSATSTCASAHGAA